MVETGLSVSGELRRSVMGWCLAGLLTPALHAGAQTAEEASTTRVPYVPTPWPVVQAMLELAQVGERDFVIDLGSGDGRVVIEAARTRGARGIGVDLDGDLVKLSNDEAKRFGVAARAQFSRQDLFETDLSAATVITMYLLPHINLALRPRLATQLRAGTRIVSHDFGLGDWKPDAQVTVPVPEKSYGPAHSTLYLWVVPAFVNGVWEGAYGDGTASGRYRLDLRQQFQRLTGTLTIGGRSAKLDAATLAGDRVAFSAMIDAAGGRVRHAFDGRSIAGELVGLWTTSGARGTRAGPTAANSASQTRALRVEAPVDGLRRN
ncbi:MAG: class I SAM-dependent methyltransferase [Proteobacteria bacterium]|nr:class I SAM-dependent methyltransferase [Burkholderiales bacterium]